MTYVDLHCHSTASDGSGTPGEVIDLARREGLSAIALTDHDTVAGVAEAAARAKELGLDFLPGIEISAAFPAPGTLHPSPVLAGARLPWPRSHRAGLKGHTRREPEARRSAAGPMRPLDQPAMPRNASRFSSSAPVDVRSMMLSRHRAASRRLTVSRRSPGWSALSVRNIVGARMSARVPATPEVLASDEEERPVSSPHSTKQGACRPGCQSSMRRTLPLRTSSAQRVTSARK